MLLSGALCGAGSTKIKVGAVPVLPCHWAAVTNPRGREEGIPLPLNEQYNPDLEALLVGR